MNSPHKTSKIWYWIIGFVAIMVGLYFMFFSGTTSPTDSTLVESGSGEVIGSQVLNLLNQIKSLKIDSAVFKSAVYKSLRDYSVTIPAENVGRDNPFAPIPGYTPKPTVTPSH
jgi:hypothetical protein